MKFVGSAATPKLDPIKFLKPRAGRRKFFFVVLGLHTMLAEQLSSIPIFREFSRLFSRRGPKIPGLDAHALFAPYFADLDRGINRTDAHRRFRIMLESNLRSYVQEGIGDKDIQEYGIEVTRANLVPNLQDESSRIVFRDYKDTDSLRDQRRNNREKYKDYPDVIDYFDLEIEAWDKLWHSILLPLEELIGEANTHLIISKLELAGFRHLDVSAFPELCTVSPGLKALFPELGDVDSIEIFEHPDKYVLTSPRHPLHHKGQTSIARLVRFVYLPKINKFAFLERGLFTAYDNDEIALFHTLDGNSSKPKFKTPEEMLQHASLLASEFTTLPPHAVFNHIIELLGHFPEIPVGDNVIKGKARSFHTQIEYLERILEFEENLMTTQPELANSLQERLKWVLEPVEHSLLRANNLDVDSQVANYVRTFSDTQLALDPKQAESSFRLGVLASYPDFATRVGSILDCSTGTMLGGLRSMPSVGGLESIIGSNAFSALKSLEGRSITNRAEFESYARALGKDPAKFPTLGKCKCPDCSSRGLNYLGPCGWCLGCEVKDDLGLGGNNSVLNFDRNADATHPYLTPPQSNGGLTNLNDTLAGFFTPPEKLRGFT